LKAIIDCYQDAERLAQNDPEDYPSGVLRGVEPVRDPLAAFVGCKRMRLRWCENATEANSYYRERRGLKAGDEVLIIGSRASGRRASVGFASEALRNRGEENNAAETGTGRSDGTESFQRSDYGAHARDFLQPQLLL